MPRHDHVILFTGYDLFGEDSGFSSNYTTGLAFIGTMCQGEGRSVSVVEDHGGFQSVGTAAHELGHSLGAEHDGLNNSCAPSDRYLMAGASYNETSANKYNPWRFSPCSINYFKVYIDSVINNVKESTCFRSKLTPIGVPNITGEMAGQLLGPDEQCRHIYGPTSYLCRGENFGDATDICRAMFCRNPKTANKCVLHSAARGTSCGNKRQQRLKVRPLSITIDDSSLSPSSAVRNLGVMFDPSLSLQPHVRSLCRSVSFCLYNISNIKKYLTVDGLKTLVKASTTSRLDYCNSLLYGTSSSNIKLLQHLQNGSARLITGSGKHYEITPMLRELHWLPCERPNTVYKDIINRKLKQVDIAQFDGDVADSNVSGKIACCQSVNAMVDEFDSIVTSLLDNQAPLIKKRVVMRPNTKWMSPEIQTAKHEKRKAEMRWRNDRLEISRQIYKQKRNKLTNLIREAKRQQRLKVPPLSITIDDSSVSPSSAMRNLGVMFDPSSSFQPHWCVEGRCVGHVDAPHRLAGCPFGDQTGVVSGGKTCKQIVAEASGYCYVKDFRTRCCSSCDGINSRVYGCEYGDRVLDCQPDYCGRKFKDGTLYNTDCCGTCNYAPPTTTPDPRLTSTPEVRCRDQSEIESITCPDYVASAGKYTCYRTDVYNACCRTCEEVKTVSAPSCPWGDRDPGQCQQLAENVISTCPRDMSSSCCETCDVIFKRTNPTSSFMETSTSTSRDPTGGSSELCSLSFLCALPNVILFVCAAIIRLVRHL
ncbi:LOW QUALITY PROTEIN: uncharacterized protein LOC124262285 [Haliotis rubra]|uniref:LOW QUALITY PROTEIN: uncharacterized protein LOC124262285 n=1 Tax=Haliotis rubra TaxID=36100 RepID=UPI001EE5A7B4|nr:LOW QUALITY PROTEIN: uncharacterized protein LOC124262285 [Haliotis rubra]